MRDYGKVSPQFWVGRTGKRIKAEGIECQLVALYLLTNPHTNMLGLYYLPIIYIAHETGLPFEGASKALRRLYQVGFCAYDEDSEFVWVYEMARYQIADSLKANDNRVGGINREYQALPKNPFLGEFFDKYGGSFHVECRRADDGEKRPSEGPPKALRSQEQEQEQEQEQSLSDASRPSECDDAPDETEGQEPQPAEPQPARPTTGSEAFKRWWAAYPKKVKKKNARDVWRRKRLDARADALIADVQRRIEGDRRWLDGYVPDPTTYLNQERWNDELQAPRSGTNNDQNAEAMNRWLNRQSQVVGEQ